MVLFLLVLNKFNSLLNTAIISLHFFFKPIAFLFFRFLIISMRLAKCRDANWNLSAPPDCPTQTELSSSDKWTTKTRNSHATVKPPRSVIGQQSGSGNSNSDSKEENFYIIETIFFFHTCRLEPQTQTQQQQSSPSSSLRAQSATLSLLLKDLSAVWKRKRLKTNFDSHLWRAEENYVLMCVYVAAERVVDMLR